MSEKEKGGRGAEGTSEPFYCTAKLLKRGFYPFHEREAHHKVLPHQLVTIPDLSAETLCPEAASTNQTHGAHFSQEPCSLEELPPSFRELNRDKSPCADLFSHQLPYVVFLTMAQNEHMTRTRWKGRVSWLSSIGSIPGSRGL